MIKWLQFKAQSLDNNSTEHYQMHENALLVDSNEIGRKITANISRISRNGRFILRRDGAEFIVLETKKMQGEKQFLMQVFANETDDVGRQAPIICIGYIESVSPDGEDACILVGKIKGFADSIQREVQEQHVEFVYTAFRELRKREFQKKTWVVSSVVLLALLLLVFGSFR